MILSKPLKIENWQTISKVVLQDFKTQINILVLPPNLGEQVHNSTSREIKFQPIFTEELYPDVDRYLKTPVTFLPVNLYSVHPNKIEIYIDWYRVYKHIGSDQSEF